VENARSHNVQQSFKKSYIRIQTWMISKINPFFLVHRYISGKIS